MVAIRLITDASARESVVLVDGEVKLDEVKFRDKDGFNYWVLTNKRFILRGNNYETVYPLRALLRFTILRNIRGGMFLWGILFTVIGGFATTYGVLSNMSSRLVMFPIIFLIIGVMLIVFSLIRPITYIEIKSPGGDIRLRVKNNYEGVVNFSKSLAQCLAE